MLQKQQKNWDVYKTPRSPFGYPYIITNSNNTNIVRNPHVLYSNSNVSYGGDGGNEKSLKLSYNLSQDYNELQDQQTVGIISQGSKSDTQFKQSSRRFYNDPAFTKQFKLKPIQNMCSQDIVIYCSNCGRRIRKNENYCPKCGNKN